MLTAWRRGACPTLAEPMPTGDGLLARIAVRGTIPLEAFAALCDAAGRYGNGVIEVTARGNLQVRGLTAATKAGFAAAVGTLDLDLATGVPIMLSPLAGLDPGERADLVGMAAKLDRALATAPFLAELGPKVSVAVDGGGALHLGAVPADVRLALSGAGRGAANRALFHLSLGGNAESAVSLGSVADSDAVDALSRLLGVIAARARTGRARDILRDEGPGSFRAAIADLIVNIPAPAPRAPAEAIGIHPLRDGASALGLALPFGHAHSDVLQTLASDVLRAGATGLRLAPGRALLFVGLGSPESAGKLQVAARRLGFIVDRSDPRRHIAACPGAPHCTSAALSTRDLAPSIASSAAALLDGSLTLHLSGCAKGCAHHGRTALTVVGIGDEAGLVIDGSAQNIPCARVGQTELPAALARLAGEVAAARRRGEQAAHTLSRLGAPHIAWLLVEEPAHG